MKTPIDPKLATEALKQFVRQWDEFLTDLGNDPDVTLKITKFAKATGLDGYPLLNIDGQNLIKITKPQRSWQEAVVRLLEVKSHLRDIKQYRGKCRHLHMYLGDMMLNQINGDVVWQVIARELKRGVKIATVNRHLAVMRAILRMARDEWQWVDSIPKI